MSTLFLVGSAYLCKCIYFFVFFILIWLCLNCNFFLVRFQKFSFSESLDSYNWPLKEELVGEEREVTWSSIFLHIYTMRNAFCSRCFFYPFECISMRFNYAIFFPILSLFFIGTMFNTDQTVYGKLLVLLKLFQKVCGCWKAMTAAVSSYYFIVIIFSFMHRRESL